MKNAFVVRVKKKVVDFPRSRVKLTVDYPFISRRMTSTKTVADAPETGGAALPERSENAGAAPSSERGKTRGKLGALRNRVALAAAGVGALVAADYAKPAVAADADAAPLVVAAVDQKPKVVLSAAELAALDPEKMDYVKYSAFFSMLKQRGISVYVHPREGERYVMPVRTRDDLRSLVDGARDMPAEGLDAVLGRRGAGITAANLGAFLDAVTDYNKYPQIVSWRTVSRDGGKTFLPVFEPNSARPRPGMEADAKKILAELDGQRRNVVDPVMQGKVPPQTVAKWAGNIATVVAMMDPRIHGRETFRRAVLNGYLGIDFQARNFEKLGVDALLGQAKDDPESGRKVYIPSGRSRLILSAATELARLTGQCEDRGCSEYLSRARIGSAEDSLKIGDIRPGDTLEILKRLTGTTDAFWTQVRGTASGEGAIALAQQTLARSPEAGALMLSETPDTMRTWGKWNDAELSRQSTTRRAILDATDRAKGADQPRLALAGNGMMKVGIADEAVSSMYWARAEKAMEKRGIDLNKAFMTPRGFDAPLGEMGGIDGDSVRDMLYGKKKTAE